MSLRSARRIAVALAILHVPVAAHAVQMAPDVSKVRLRWAEAPGPVADYVVNVSRNAGPEQTIAIVAQPEAEVSGQPGDRIVVRVAARDAAANQGPFSPPSEPIVFSEPAGDPNDGSGAGGDPDAPTANPVPTDLDGDGRSEVLLNDEFTGLSQVYRLDGDALVPVRSPATLPPEWELAGSADHDANGAADLVWRDRGNGRLDLWLFDGGVLVGGGVLRGAHGSEWTLAALADLGGDGRPEWLLREPVSGDLDVWEVNGLEATSVATLPAGPGPEWTLVGAGDFDGDGRDDLVWRSASLGRLELWRMAGAEVLEQRVLRENLDESWEVTGVGDFDGDDLADVLVESRSSPRLGFLSPLAGTEWQEIAGDAAERELLGLGDHDGDGRSDLLWRDHDAGELVLWHVDPATGVSRLALADPIDTPSNEVASCEGDLDGDGRVGTSDYGMLRSCFGRRAEGECAVADTDGDGRIGGSDFARLRKLFGSVCR